MLRQKLEKKSLKRKTPVSGAPGAGVFSSQAVCLLSRVRLEYG